MSQVLLEEAAEEDSCVVKAAVAGMALVGVTVTTAPTQDAVSHWGGRTPMPLLDLQAAAGICSTTGAVKKTEERGSWDWEDS